LLYASSYSCHCQVLQCSNPQCRRRFSNLTAVRRHHCRACGSVVCGACSRGKASLPLLGYDFSTLLRVCTPCLEAGAGAAATHEARERKAADPQVLLMEPIRMRNSVFVLAFIIIKTGVCSYMIANACVCASISFLKYEMIPYLGESSSCFSWSIGQWER